MKKYKKRLSVILSAVIVLSSGMVQAFAAESESEIAWQYEQGRSVNTNSVQITCYLTEILKDSLQNFAM